MKRAGKIALKLCTWAIATGAFSTLTWLGISGKKEKQEAIIDYMDSDNYRIIREAAKEELNTLEERLKSLGAKVSTGEISIAEFENENQEYKKKKSSYDDVSSFVKTTIKGTPEGDRFDKADKKENAGGFAASTAVIMGIVSAIPIKKEEESE